MHYYPQKINLRWQHLCAIVFRWPVRDLRTNNAEAIQYAAILWVTVLYYCTIRKKNNTSLNFSRNTDLTRLPSLYELFKIWKPNVYFRKALPGLHLTIASFCLKDFELFSTKIFWIPFKKPRCNRSCRSRKARYYWETALKIFMKFSM